MFEPASTALAVSVVAGALLSTGGSSDVAEGVVQKAETPPACTRQAEPAKRDSRPILLILHPGGFILPATETIESACELASEAGFDIVFVRYVLGNLPEAVSTSRRIAEREGRRGPPVLAYGESAGGTLAALLAQEGLVDAAATYSQLTDLVGYYERTPDPKVYKSFVTATNQDLRELSPGFTPAGNPIFAMLAAEDDPALNREAEAWDRREPSVTAIDVEGPHIGAGDPATHDQNVARALRWLQRQVKPQS